MEAVKPLTAFARSKTGKLEPEQIVEASRALSADRVILAACEGGAQASCIWHGDIDAVAAAFASLGIGDLVWSDPKIEYRHGMVETSVGVKRHVVLEPVMAVEVVVAPEYIGNVIGDLSSRRGIVVGQGEHEGGRLVVAAEVQLEQLAGYPVTLQQLTQGSGAVTVDFKRFDVAPSWPPPGDPAAAALRVA